MYENESPEKSFIFNCESLYLNMETGLPNHRMNREIIEKIKREEESSFDEHRLNNLLTTSGIFKTKHFKKWNFHDIFEIIDNIGSNDKVFQDLSDKKFFRKLIKFFQPSNHAFIDLEWKPENFIYARVGYSLITI